MEIELILVERCDSAVTTLEVFRTLEQQLDLLYRLPRYITAAGLQSDDGVVLALLGMIAATARRRMDEMSNTMSTLSAPWFESSDKGSQETRAGPSVMSTGETDLRAPEPGGKFSARLRQPLCYSNSQ